jgi:hypothetical protein
MLLTGEVQDHDHVVFRAEHADDHVRCAAQQCAEQADGDGDGIEAGRCAEEVPAAPRAARRPG